MINRQNTLDIRISSDDISPLNPGIDDPRTVMMDGNPTIPNLFSLFFLDDRFNSDKGVQNNAKEFIKK